MDVLEVAPGLWAWSAPHPAWQPGKDWAELVWSTYAELPEATVLVDPLVPRDDDERFWRHLDADVARRGAPVAVLLTARHHRRSADVVAARYDATIWDGDGELTPGVQTFPIDHPQPVERPMWLEPHRALVFGDALTRVDDELRVWWDFRWPVDDDWYAERLLPSLRPLAELPVEHVLTGHGAPLLGPELGAALDRPPVHAA